MYVYSVCVCVCVCIRILNPYTHTHLYVHTHTHSTKQTWLSIQCKRIYVHIRMYLLPLSPNRGQFQIQLTYIHTYIHTYSMNWHNIHSTSVVTILCCPLSYWTNQIEPVKPNVYSMNALYALTHRGDTCHLDVQRIHFHRLYIIYSTVRATILHGIGPIRSMEWGIKHWVGPWHAKYAELRNYRCLAHKEALKWKLPDARSIGLGCHSPLQGFWTCQFIPSSIISIPACNDGSYLC